MKLRLFEQASRPLPSGLTWPAKASRFPQGARLRAGPPRKVQCLLSGRAEAARPARGAIEDQRPGVLDSVGLGPTEVAAEEGFWAQVYYWG